MKKKELGRKLTSLGLAGVTFAGNLFGVANAFPVMAETTQAESDTTSTTGTNYDNLTEAEYNTKIASCDEQISEYTEKLNAVNEKLESANKTLDEAKEAYDWGGIKLLDSLVTKETSKIETQWELLKNSSDPVVVAGFNLASEEEHIKAFSFDNLRYCGYLLNETNDRIQADDNVSEEKKATLQKLQPDLTTWAFQASMIGVQDLAKYPHYLIRCTDSVLSKAQTGGLENQFWGSYENPLVPWYDEEKVIYDKDNNADYEDVGHYENIIACNGSVGIGRSFNYYKNLDKDYKGDPDKDYCPVWTMRLSSLSANACTYDEWIALINEAEAPLLKAKNEAQAVVDELTEEKSGYETILTKAKTDKDALEAAKKKEAETEIVVTVTENSESYTYDGKEKTDTGYTITSISNKNYTEKDFSFVGSDSDTTVSATDAGTYDIKLSADDFKNNSEFYNNVTFKIVDGTLNIKQKGVTITGESDSKTYDGKETELTKTETEGLLEGDELTGVSYSAKGADADTYTGKFSGNAVIKNEEGKNVTDNYAIEEKTGTLTISPSDAEITVTVTTPDESREYDGTEQTMVGWNVDIDKSNLSSDMTYTENDFLYNGTDESQQATGTNVGTYTTGMTAENFSNENPNYSNVKFVVKNGTLTITKRKVTISGVQEKVTYDGKSHYLSTTALTADGLASGHWLKESITSAVLGATEVGTYTCSHKCSIIDGNAGVNQGNDVTDNYDVTLIEPTLTILPSESTDTDKDKEDDKDKEIVVTIKGKSGSYVYDGTNKRLVGYTVTVTGDDEFDEGYFDYTGSILDKTVSGTVAGTYTMSMTADDFEVDENWKEDYPNVKFVVEPGTITITRRPITITGKSESKEYTGEEQTITDYEVTEGSLVNDQTISGITYSAKGTAVGEYEGSFTGDISIQTTNKKDRTDCYDITTVPGKLTITEKSGGSTDTDKDKGDTGTDTDKDKDKETSDKINDEVIVTITENSAEYTYDGTEKTDTGYTVSVDNSNVTGDTKYTESDFTCDESKATISATNAGTYDMNLSASDFTNTNDKFTNVKFVVKDGTLKINQREITVTGKSDSIKWSDSAQTLTGYDITSADKLVDGHELTGLTYEATGTEVGDYEGKFTGTAKVMNDDEDVTDNYKITTVVGTLSITENEELRKQKEEEQKAAEEEAKKKAEEEAKAKEEAEKKAAEEEAKRQEELKKQQEAAELKAKNAKIISKVKLSTYTYTYNGKVKTPSVTVYDKNGNKMSSSAYSVSYPSGRKNLGAYTFKVTAKSGYSGSASATFIIKPATMKKPTLKAGKKKVTVKWKKLGGGSQTYQIAIAKKGSSYKYYTSTGSSKTIGKLSSKKTYVVKVRAYKKINGSNQYGSWSSSKSVKVK